MFLNKKKTDTKTASQHQNNPGRRNHTIYLGINAFIEVNVIVVTDFVIKFCVNIKNACMAQFRDIWLDVIEN